MRNKQSFLLAFVGVVAMGALVAVGAQTQQPTVKIPNPGVPQVMTLEGQYVRIAYNNEGYVTLGYRVANQSVGEEWMLLEMGVTVRDGKPDLTLTRDAVSLETPDKQTIRMATNSEYQAAGLRGLEQRAKVVRDSINYFPPDATQGCRVGYFAELGSRAMAYDQVELDSGRGCVGRLYFKVPGGIKYGQHWLNVKFHTTVVRVPFRILTEEEAKLLSKSWKDIKQQVDDAFRKKS
jgi:hypothetical protein